MDNPQDDHPGADDFEDGTVFAKQQVAIGRPEEIIFRYKGAALRVAFQGCDLFFKLQNKRGSCFGIILGDVIPDVCYICLRRSGDINSVFFGHV